MKKFINPIRLVALFAPISIGACIAMPNDASASSTVVVQCVQTSSACSNGINNNSMSSAGDTVIAQGYYQPGDGGGGQFADIGSCDTASSYNTIAAVSPGDTTVQISTAGLAVGSLIKSVSGTRFILGTQIVAILGPNKISISIPVQTAGPAGLAVNIYGPNLGTLQLNNSMPKHCLVKTDYQGDPREWGAYGNGTTDDTAALQAWLAGPGPWDAKIPSVYETASSLTCWPNINIRAATNNSHAGNPGPSPLITVQAGSSYSGTSPVVSAQTYCHISGLAIDANGKSGVDAVDIAGPQVVIDQHSLLENGQYNLKCDGMTGTGLQLKDSQFGPSYADNIYLGSMCPNVRVIGDVIAKAGLLAPSSAPWTAGHPAGIYATNDELTISNGVVEESIGAGIDLETARQVRVIGMHIDGSGDINGTSALDDPGVLINSSNHVSICSNNFHRNDGLVSATYGAQVRLGGVSDDISFCGNVYYADDQNGGSGTAVPAFVYDVTPGSTLTHTTLYEAAEPQTSGIFTTRAASTLNTRRVCPSGGC